MILFQPGLLLCLKLTLFSNSYILYNSNIFQYILLTNIYSQLRQRKFLPQKILLCPLTSVLTLPLLLITLDLISISVRLLSSRMRDKWNLTVCTSLCLVSSFLFLINILFIYFQRGEGREKERQRNINVWLPLVRPLLRTWPTTQACTLGWELNRQPFVLQAGTQSTEPHQPGICIQYLLLSIISVRFIHVVVYNSKYSQLLLSSM